MFNILIGLLFIIGGLSGFIELRGTGSTTALAAVGAGLVVWGIRQVMSNRRRKKPQRSDNNSEKTP